jgi:hypothetical protein
MLELLIGWYQMSDIWNNPMKIVWKIQGGQISQFSVEQGCLNNGGKLIVC